MQSINAVAELSSFVANSEAFIARMQAEGAFPNEQKSQKRIYGPGEAARLVGRDRTTIARAEELLKIVPQRDPESGRRLGYKIPDIQAFRSHFGTLPWRDPTRDSPLIIDVQNFKGGVGKSTTVVNLAHYLAEAGLRVLIIDTDSQATATAYFGYIPDRDLTRVDTIYPFLNGDKSDLQYAIRKTHWPTIDLIPACLQLSDVESGGILRLAGEESAESRLDFFRELRHGIDTVSQNYDVVLLDTPPAMGIMSLLDLVAADALLIPTTAQMPDFASTAQFARMIRDYLKNIDPSKEFRWIQLLITKYSKRGKQSADEKTMQEKFYDVIRQIFKGSVFETVIYESNEIQNDAAIFSTPYEQETPNRRVLVPMGNAFAEVEKMIHRCWPSKTEQLERRGLA